VGKDAYHVLEDYIRNNPISLSHHSHAPKEVIPRILTSDISGKLKSPSMSSMRPKVILKYHRNILKYSAEDLIPVASKSICSLISPQAGSDLQNSRCQTCLRKLKLGDAEKKKVQKINTIVFKSTR
jgi:hypothetical protein